MACPICDGSGWKTIESEGRSIAARCECWRERSAGRLLAAARIPKRYQHCSLETFTTYPNEPLLRAVSFARRFIDEFPASEKGLILIGPPGIGKSHLAVSVLKAVIIEKGARGLFYDVPELLRLIRATYNPVSRTAEMDILQPCMDTDVLVLDDIGREKTSEWVADTLNLIVNTRYNERRVTIFTSNYEVRDEQELPDRGEEFRKEESLEERVGFRMYSRLYEMCEFLEYDGPDYRHLPPNAGADDLYGLWTQRRPGRMPSRAGGQVKARLRGDGRADLKWPGGRAGS